MIKASIRRAWRMKIWSDLHGQELIEYALLSGFVVIAAATMMVSVTNTVSKVFNRITSTMTAAATGS